MSMTGCGGELGRTWDMAGGVQGATKFMENMW